MLALKKDFEAIKDLKKNNLSFNDYIKLKDVVKALARMKSLNLSFDIYVFNERIAKWLEKREELRVNHIIISYRAPKKSDEKWAVNWR